MQQRSNHYDPPGPIFMDKTLGEVKLVTAGHSKGWLARRGAEGQWVTVRLATTHDHLTFEKPANTGVSP